MRLPLHDCGAWILGPEKVDCQQVIADTLNRSIVIVVGCPELSEDFVECPVFLAMDGMYAVQRMGKEIILPTFAGRAGGNLCPGRFYVWPNTAVTAATWALTLGCAPVAMVGCHLGGGVAEITQSYPNEMTLCDGPQGILQASRQIARCRGDARHAALILDDYYRGHQI